MLNADERSVLERLERFVQRIDDIREMFDAEGELPPTDVQMARARYAALKKDLIAEYKSNSNSRRQPPLTKAEEVWYERAIHQASAHLRARTNAAPRDWRSSLSEARMDLDVIVFNIRERDQK